MERRADVPLTFPVELDERGSSFSGQYIRSLISCFSLHAHPARSPVSRVILKFSEENFKLFNEAGAMITHNGLYKRLPGIPE